MGTLLITRPITSRIVLIQHTFSLLLGQKCHQYFLNLKLVRKNKFPLLKLYIRVSVIDTKDCYLRYFKVASITLPLHLVCIWNPNAITTMNWLPHKFYKWFGRKVNVFYFFGTCLLVAIKKRVGIDNLYLWGDGRSQGAQLRTNFKAVDSSLLND